VDISLLHGPGNSWCLCYRRLLGILVLWLLNQMLMLHEVFVVALNPYVPLEVLELLSYCPLSLSLILQNLYIFIVTQTSNFCIIIYGSANMDALWYLIQEKCDSNPVSACLLDMDMLLTEYGNGSLLLCPWWYFINDILSLDVISLACVPYGWVCSCSSFSLSVQLFLVQWRFFVFCDGWMSPDMSSAATLFLPCFVSDWLITGWIVIPLLQQGCAIHDLIIDICYYGFEVGYWRREI